MKELFTRSQADTVIWIVAGLGVVGAPVAAMIARRRGESPVKYAVTVGGPLILVAIMWHIYNAIEDRLGLDSVAALAMNFGIFVTVGGTIGFVWTMVNGRRKPDLTNTDAAAVGVAAE